MEVGLDFLRNIHGPQHHRKTLKTTYLTFEAHRQKSATQISFKLILIGSDHLDFGLG